MGGRLRGSSSSVTWLGRAGCKRRARLHFTIAGWLLIGLAGLLRAPGVLPAATDQASAPDIKAATKGSVDSGPLAGEETLICPDDLLYIQVYDVDQMTREVRVSAAGNLALPLLPDPIRAAGLTPVQLAELISKKYKEAGILSHPQISITIRESRVHSVAISGAVRSPQVFPVFGRIALMDLLAQAGGVSDDAGSLLTITRGDIYSRAMGAEGGGETVEVKSRSFPLTQTIDLQRLLDTGDPSLNVDVYPGDRVAVLRAGVVYVVGAVNRPGAFLLTSSRRGMTVLRAIALAESLSPNAQSKKVLILRPNPSDAKGRGRDSD